MSLGTRQTWGTLCASDCPDLEAFQREVILLSPVRGIMTTKREVAETFQAFPAPEAAWSPGRFA